MLAPVESLHFFRALVKSHCKDRVTFGVTTNLVYKLTDKVLGLFEKLDDRRVSTSWDPKIRFANDKQLKLWESNVKRLVELGYDIKLFVSVSKDVVDMEPVDILQYAIGLGITEIDFERITHDGNATRNHDIFPSNKEIDEWLMKLHLQTEEYGLREKIDNHLLENVYIKFERNLTTAGTFCRTCEQHLFTINADGTIAGCPNSAPTAHFAAIDQPVADVLRAPGRMGNILTEATVNVNCITCPVYKYCGGDCYQLQWEGNICPAPKTLMIHLDNIRK